MRPMKLAGSELLFGEGCLEYLKTSVHAQRVFIVLGGAALERNGTLEKVETYLHEGGAQTSVFRDVEPEPHFSTIRKGAEAMLAWEPDLICALGGGSAMDAAKAMWVLYEHPELDTIKKFVAAKPLPKLRTKARCLCIPSTSGTASEVSRSVVISDDETGHKHGVGDMEMMPDIALIDPDVSKSMPPHITAETGLDALTHATEALVSNRANYVADILGTAAALDIIKWLPYAYHEGNDMQAREMMATASMVAGLAFTNVSLGIVHSMAQTIGGFFPVAHGRLCAILMPFVIDWNSQDARAKSVYDSLAAKVDARDYADVVRKLNTELGISTLAEAIPDEQDYFAHLDEMAQISLEDGCTKTNPIIPTVAQFAELLTKAYRE